MDLLYPGLDLGLLCNATPLLLLRMCADELPEAKAGDGAAGGKSTGSGGLKRQSHELVPSDLLMLDEGARFLAC